MLDTIIEEENSSISVERPKKFVTSRTKAIIIDIPNNSTGMCVNEKEMLDTKRIECDYIIYLKKPKY